MKENTYNKLDAKGGIIGGIVLSAEFEDETAGISECQKLTGWMFWEKRLEESEKALKYLAETDWYVVRFAETGEPIPEDILAARAAAREKI